MSYGKLDVNAGSVFIEIPMMLSSESGEAKHMDLNNQGLLMAYQIADMLKKFNSEGAALSEITFWGTTIPGQGECVRRIDFAKDL